MARDETDNGACEDDPDPNHYRELLSCPKCEYTFLVGFQLDVETHIYAVTCPQCDQPFMARAIDRDENGDSPARVAPRATKERPQKPKPLAWQKVRAREERVVVQPKPSAGYERQYPLPSPHPYRETAPAPLRSRERTRPPRVARDGATAQIEKKELIIHRGTTLVTKKGRDGKSEVSAPHEVPVEPVPLTPKPSTDRAVLSPEARMMRRKFRFVAILLVLCASLGLLMGAFTVAQNEPALEDHAADATFTLTGKIMDHQGRELEGVAVTVVSDSDMGRINTTTNSDGYYYFDAVAPDDYTVVIEAAGYRPVERTVTVDDGAGVVEENFVLERGDDALVVDERVAARRSSARYNGLVGYLMIAFSLLVIPAAVLAWYRRGYHIVLIGSLIGVATFGFGVGSVFGAVAAVLTIILRKGFGSLWQTKTRTDG